MLYYNDTNITPLNYLTEYKDGFNWGNGYAVDTDDDNKDIIGVRAKAGDIIDPNTYIATYASTIINTEQMDEYVNEIKDSLRIGRPVIICVYRYETITDKETNEIKFLKSTTHFVTIVGVRSGVDLDNAQYTDFVMFDPGTSQDAYKLTTLDNTYVKYTYYPYNYRKILPYLVDENKNFILDENDKKTTDPYYIDPYKDFNGKVLSFDEGHERERQIKKSIINALIDPDIPDYKKESIARQLIDQYCKDDISDEEYKRLKKACEDKRIVAGATVTTTVTYAKANVATARDTRYDPLILDLDGDGYNIETKKNGANFDLDKNGFAERINWTSRDGFLCLDLNGNGTIDNGGELFGDQTLLADGTRAKNGFEALARHDSNGDGIIDADDEIFDSLRIWVDADGSGTTDEGELKTLAELGIVSINLVYDNVNDETGTEAMIGNSATFTRKDGTTGGVGELWVSSDLYDTVDNVSVEVPDEIKEMPNVRSIGNVYSLHNAMALDETLMNMKITNIEYDNDYSFYYFSHFLCDFIISINCI